MILASSAASQSHEPPKRIQAAEGVYVFVTPPYGDVGFDGNSVAILSSEGVLVFDTNGTKAAAEAVLAEIRKLTDKPVKYVVNSHWHWDHWYGTEVYTQAFPGVTVVAHENTRALMAGPAPRAAYAAGADLFEQADAEPGRARNPGLASRPCRYARRLVSLSPEKRRS